MLRITGVVIYPLNPFGAAAARIIWGRVFFKRVNAVITVLGRRYCYPMTIGVSLPGLTAGTDQRLSCMGGYMPLALDIFLIGV